MLWGVHDCWDVAQAMTLQAAAKNGRFASDCEKCGAHLYW